MNPKFDSSKIPDQQEKPDFIKFDYAHLIVECTRCGHKKIMDRNIEGGINLYLPATDKHELKLSCDNCGNSMRMFYIKSDKVKSPEEKEKEKVIVDEMLIDEKRTKKKVKKDEISKSSKKEKSVPANSKSS